MLVLEMLMLEDLIKQSEKSEGKINARERSRIETRRRLLLSGAKEFAKNGFERTSISVIAKDAGVATGTVFFHFNSKEGLFREIALYYLSELHTRLRASNQIPTKTIEESLRNHTETVVGFIEENHGLFNIIVNRLVLGEDFGNDIKMLLVEEQAKRFEEGISEGVFRDDVNVNIASRATIGMLLGVVTWWLNSPGNTSREGLIDTITKLRSSMLSTSKRS